MKALGMGFAMEFSPVTIRGVMLLGPPPLWPDLRKRSEQRPSVSLRATRGLD